MAPALTCLTDWQPVLFPVADPKRWSLGPVESNVHPSQLAKPEEDLIQPSTVAGDHHYGFKEGGT